MARLKMEDYGLYLSTTSDPMIEDEEEEND
jgi:hypothetical protein